MLQLLGDELIGSARLAVLGLVKNPYDVDANKVVVRLDIASAQKLTITVTDEAGSMGARLGAHGNREEQRTAPQT